MGGVVRRVFATLLPGALPPSLGTIVGEYAEEDGEGGVVRCARTSAPVSRLARVARALRVLLLPNPFPGSSCLVARNRSSPRGSSALAGVLLLFRR